MLRALTLAAALGVAGHSSLGRPIELAERGSPAAPSRVLVVGCIHGTECAGIAIVRRLLAMRPPARVALWMIPNLNPDGYAAGHRQNGRGVDLNRNFPSGWRPLGSRWDPEYPGPEPGSEPETRLAMRLILRIRPTITIWFHQPLGLVRAWGASIPAARRYAQLAGLPFRRIPWLAGTAPNWQNHRLPGTSSFVVELPPGPLSGRQAQRYADAVLRVAG